MEKLPQLDVRIPKWNKDDLLVRNCPICDSPNVVGVYERPDGLNVQVCKQCSAFSISPGPSEAQLNSFYENYDESHRRAKEMDIQQVLAQYQHADTSTDLRLKELSSIMNFEGARVLDIGFGRAFLLYCMKEAGAIPYGIELDPVAVELAHALGVNNAVQSSIDEFNPGIKFDLVILNDVIEHPLLPMDLLKKAVDLLAPNGLLMIWTPNGDYSQNHPDCITFRVDLEHMQYLTTESCLSIASELKMKVAHLETLGFPALEGITESKLERANNALTLKSMLKSTPGFSILNSLRHRLINTPGRDERAGSYNLFCILQKPPEP